jgi:hypothetical protein
MTLRLAEGRVDHSAFRRIKEVAKWEAELALRSRLTAGVRVRGLALFCHQVGLSPNELATKAREFPTLSEGGRDSPSSLKSILSEYAQAADAKGLRAAYVAKTFDCLRSWFEFRSVPANPMLFPKLSNCRNETVENEAAPTQEQVRLLLGALSSRGRAIALLMAQSGVRPGVLGNVDGTDGLTLASLPEMDLETLRFARIPTRLQVASKQSKNRLGYVSFVGPEGIEAIQVMLSERRQKGEELRPDSPLIASLGAGVGKRHESPKGPGGFVTTKVIAFDLREAIRSLDLSFRPYSLRAAFSSAMFIAEVKGAMVRDAREAMMGHDLGPAGRYHLGKKLNPALLDEMRGLYERAYPYLSTTAAAATSNEEVFRLILTEFFNYDSADLAKAGPLTADRVRELADARRKSEQESETGATPGSQKVVEVSAIESYISKGWRFVAPLNGTKAILEAPGVA